MSKPIYDPFAGQQQTQQAPAPKWGQPGNAFAQNNYSNEDMVRRIKIVTTSFPRLGKHPKAVLALANQQIGDDDLATAAARTYGFTLYKDRANALKDMADDKQRDAWDQATKTDRRLLKKAGYGGPPQEDDGGFLGQLGDLADSTPGLGAITHAVRGDFEGAAKNIPGVGGVAALASGAGPGEIIGRTTGINQVVGFAQEGAQTLGKSVDDVASGAGMGLNKVGLGDVAETIGSAARDTEETIRNDVVSPALHGLDVVGKVPSHIYRAGKELVNDPGFRQALGAETQTAPGGTHMVENVVDRERQAAGLKDSKVDVWDAWEKTSNGERYFTQTALNDAAAHVDDNPILLDLARQFAGGSSMEEIAAKYGAEGSKDYTDAYIAMNGLQDQEQFGKAVSTLQQGKVSPGRDVARGLGLSLNSTGGTLVSGASDALFDWYLDPLLIAGKARHAWKLAGAIDSLEGVRAAQAGEAVTLEGKFGSNWADQLANGTLSTADIAGAAPKTAAAHDIASTFKTVNTSDSVGTEGTINEYFTRQRPRLAALIDPLLSENRRLIEERGTGIEQADDIWRWYQREEGAQSFVNGSWQQGTVDHFQLPKLTSTGIRTSALRFNVDKAIDFMAAKPLVMKSALTAEDVSPLQSALVADAGSVEPAADGFQRLWRVGGGAPNDIGANRANLWWTDDLERARQAGTPLRQFGQLFHLDVPVDDLAKFEDVSNPLYKKLGASDYLVTPEANAGATHLGAVGGFAEVGDQVMAAPFRMLLGPPARLFKMLSTRVPESGVISLYGPNAPTQINRLLDMEYAGSAKDQVASMILQADSPALRREMVRGAMDRVFWSNGVYANADGRELATQYLDGLNQQYASDGLDLMMKGTRQMSEGLLPMGDHADQIAMPSFRDVMAQSHRVGVLNGLFGMVNKPMVDAFMGSYWKPAMLFRLGFAPRAAAEEMLASALRAPEIFTQRQWLKLATPDEPVGLLQHVADAAQAFGAHIPVHIAEDPALHWEERFSHFLTNTASGWVRGMAANQVDPDMLRAAKLVAGRPELQLAHAEGMSKISGSRGNYGALDDDTPWLEVPLNAEGTEFGKFRRSNSRFSEYDINDSGYLASWQMQANRWAKDPTGRAISDARNLYLDEGQAKTIAGHLGDEVHGADGYAKAQRIADEMDLHPKFRRAYKNYLDALGDETRVGELPQHLNNVKKAAGNSIPLDVLADAAAKMPNDTRWALLADKKKVLTQLDNPAVVLDDLQSEIDKPMGAVTGDLPVATEDQRRRWQQLANEAANGDETSAKILGQEVALRQLQHPVTARYAREMTRGIQDSAGNVVAKPVAEGMVRVYYPTFDAKDADQIRVAVDTSSATGQRFLAGEDPVLIDAAKARQDAGQEAVHAVSRWSTTTFEDAQSLADQITQNSIKTGKRINVGLASVDVPEEQVRAYRQIAPQNPFEYGITPAQGLKGVPIDPTGRLITTEDGAVSNGISYHESLQDWAEKLNQRFDQVHVSPQGRVLHEVSVRGAEAGHVDGQWIFHEGPPSGDLPAKMLGPHYYMSKDPVMQQIFNWGFDNVIGKMVNSVSRNPLYTHNLLRRVSLAENTLRPALTDPAVLERAEGIASKLGMKSAEDIYDFVRLRVPEGVKAAGKAVPEEQVVHSLIESGVAPEGIEHLNAEEWNSIHSYIRNEDVIRKAVGESSMEGALKDSIPFIDDHHMRSQFADQVRNFSPFWWAQEAFFRRWGKTLVHAPEAIRKGQLIMQGARHAGIIHTDPETGEDTFVIPGTPQLFNVVNKGIEMITGEPAQLPVQVAITGEVKMSTPGFDAIGVPSYGPLVGIPFALLRRHFPELGATEEGVLGERGAGRGIIEQLVPSTVSNIYKAVTADPQTSAQLMSASIQAMQYMEAHNLAPAPDAPPAKREEYIKRVTNWARNLLIFRGMFGFADIAPPVLDFKDTISPELHKLMQNLPIEDAISEMIRRHPDATPYTVFQTKSTSGAPMGATEEVGKFLDDNRAFVKSHVLASSWMLPQSNSDEPTERRVFALQQELGLRAHKTAEEWYTDYQFAQGASTYFKSKDAYETERAVRDDAGDRASLDSEWADWKTKYFKQHPVFADELQTRKGHTRRVNTIEDLNNAFTDPNVPQFAHSAQLKTSLQSWNNFTTALADLKGQKGSKATDDRRDLEVRYYDYATAYATKHPAVQAFWQRILMPELETLSGGKLNTTRSGS